jgi:tetratricopeptide (TPR) repeat protein
MNLTLALLLAHAQLDRGAALLKAGHVLEADAVFAQVVRAEPKNADALLWLASSALPQRELDRAEELAKKALELDPKSSRAQLVLGQVYAVQINDVSIFSRLSHAGKIREAFQSAVDADPSSADAHQALAEYYLEAPGIAGGGVDKARAQVAELTRVDKFRGLIARALIAAHEKEDPAPFFLQAVEAAKTDEQRAQAAGAFAGVLLRQKKLPEATAQLRKAAELAPREAWPRLSLADALLDSGDTPGAEAAVHKALELDPERPVAFFYLGQVLEKKGARPEARAAYEKYLRLSPPKVMRAGIARERLKEL